MGGCGRLRCLSFCIEPRWFCNGPLVGPLSLVLCLLCRVLGLVCDLALVYGLRSCECLCVWFESALSVYVCGGGLHFLACVYC
jgi:hypothetical protein